MCKLVFGEWLGEVVSASCPLFCLSGTREVRLSLRSLHLDTHSLTLSLFWSREEKAVGESRVPWWVAFLSCPLREGGDNELAFDKGAAGSAEHWIWVLPTGGASVHQLGGQTQDRPKVRQASFMNTSETGGLCSSADCAVHKPWASTARQTNSVLE